MVNLFQPRQRNRICVQLLSEFLVGGSREEEGEREGLTF